MKIEIHDFYSLKNVEFSLYEGINVLAGKNGSGKSQLLILIANQFGNQTLGQYGFEKPKGKTIITIDPRPKKVLWRPPIRKIGEGSKHEFYAKLDPLSYIKGSNFTGYTHSVDERYVWLHSVVTQLFIAGNIKNAKENEIKNWGILSESFKRVFGKEIIGEFTSDGGRVGLLLPNREISKFATLSTGELEFLSIISDILKESEVDLFLIDEIDAHFHPDLQKVIINEINNVLEGRTALITTHSPSVMLSVPMSNLFYLKKDIDVGEGENQIVKLSNDIELLDKVSEMYAGFIPDIRLQKHLLEKANYEMFVYANKCLEESGVLSGEKAKDYEPQTSYLRAILTSKKGDYSFYEIGAGKGRLLKAFQSMKPESMALIDYYAIDHEGELLKELEGYADELKVKDKFKSFHAIEKIDEGEIIDVCLLANIIHEVGPDNLSQFFNKIFKNCKVGSQILVLEALELAVGEKRYVLFNPAAFEALFHSLIYKGCISTNYAPPVSHNGTPLLEYNITIRSTEGLELTKKDIMLGLDAVIQRGSSIIKDNLEDSKLGGRQLGFISHNIANASAYRLLMESN
ncbi:MAG TPA: AAA family ATPase [Saprospiraceae bacterium]|nr:AAA family ATPase [Saprospiraceae bacterium]